MAQPAPFWFAEQSGDFLLFRVNRRPIGEDTLLPADVPDDVLDHFRRVLAPGWRVVTGRKNQRVWMVGGIEVADPEDTVLVGKLGWVPAGTEVIPEWSEEEEDWVSSSATPHGGKILPFGFEADTRVLTVLRDSSTPATTIAQVFERTLRDNERELPEPTTEWSVEPILDPADFVEWLESVEVVTAVSFSARLPNPEPRAAFADLVERMERRRATRFHESFESKLEGGLSGVQEDPEFQQAAQMAEQGFATLSGTGQRAGRGTRYRQTERVAHERVDDLPATWEEMRDLLIRFLKERAQRFLDDK